MLCFRGRLNINAIIMDDHSHDNSSGPIVAIFAIVVIVGMAIAYFMYAQPAVPAPAPAPAPAPVRDTNNIEIKIPAPQEGGNEGGDQGVVETQP